MGVNLTKGPVVGYVVHPFGGAPAWPSTFIYAERADGDPLAYMSVTVGWGERRMPGVIDTPTGKIREAIAACRRHLARHGTWVQRVQVIRAAPQSPQDDWPAEEYERDTPADGLGHEIALDYQ